MIINDKRKPTTVEFGSLKICDCFIDEEGAVCMRIPFNSDVDVGLDGANCIDLETGELFYFGNDQEVIKVNARLEVF